MFLYRQLGFQIRSRSVIAAGATFKGTNVVIGDDVFINHQVYVDRGSLSIGDKVSIGPRTTFLTQNHELGDQVQRAGTHVRQDIVVGSGTWIGACVTVLGGVRIGTGAVIAAGAVVTRDCDANALYAGVPARKIKELPS